MKYKGSLFFYTQLIILGAHLGGFKKGSYLNKLGVAIFPSMFCLDIKQCFKN